MQEYICIWNCNQTVTFPWGKITELDKMIKHKVRPSQQGKGASSELTWKEDKKKKKLKTTM